MSHPAPPPPYQPPASTASPAATPGGPGIDLRGTASIPLARLVQVELRKALDTLASFWFVVGLAIIVVGTEVLLTIAIIVQEEPSTPGDYASVASFITGIGLPVLAIMLVTTEWSQRTAMVTFTIEPRRERVLLAKYAVCLVLTIATVLLALVLGFVCAGVCELALPDLTTWEVDWSVIAGFFITQVLAMTLGFALACLLLNTPAAIVGFFVYRLLPLLVFSAIGGFFEWFQDVQPYIDFEVAKGPLYDLSLDSAEELLQLLTSGLLWLGLPLGFGLWRILRAEVK
ncbi:ABC transporter permease [Nocardioides litoris]|uniref:ABC transporter permease n=1 Tax=Nocardioides litoris TaxID=1926648 RepID=UPI001FE95A1D|nr:ABC transporter permease [Nocardioides litoris]